MDDDNLIQDDLLKQILASLERMKKLLKTPWSFRRSENLQHLISEKWNEIGTLLPAMQHAAAITKDKTDQIRPIYSAKDLAKMTLEKVKDAKFLPEQVYLFAPISDNLLCLKYSIQFDENEMNPKYKESEDKITSRSERWLKKLNIDKDLNAYEINRYRLLKQHVKQHQLFTDILIFQDVKNTAVDSDYYFVYEDFLLQNLIIFSRDPEVVQLAFEENNIKTLRFIQCSRKSEDDVKELQYPPNGVIPFHGISLLMAPLCYIFSNPELLYVVFKTMFCKYFIKLHTIRTNYDKNEEIVFNQDEFNGFKIQNNNKPNHGIISLCINVEQRLLIKSPQLVQHLCRLGISITETIFPWIFSAYSIILPPDEILNLWDFIIMKHSLFPLTDLAVAIFLWREATLFSCDEANSIEAVLRELSAISVHDLLHYYF